MTTVSDHALIKDGVVTTVARYPVAPAAFGPNPDGDIVAFDPAAEVCAGQLWDGETLSNPPPPED